MRRLNRIPIAYNNLRTRHGRNAHKQAIFFYTDGAPFLNRDQQEKLDEMAEDTIQLIKMNKFRDHKKL